jgi:hypothetical protein
LITLPPARVAGTAELMGPVQKPVGSGAGAVAVLAEGGFAVSAASAGRGDAASIDARERIRATRTIRAKQ